MKTNKILSLDMDLVEKLKKEANGSALVNRLLVSYFEGENMENWTKEQLETHIAGLKLKQKHKEELEALKSE